MSKIIIKWETIDEIMNKFPNSAKRIELQSKFSKTGTTTFIPWFRKSLNDVNIWVGVERWKGNNNNSVTIATHKADDWQFWKVKKVPFPILSKNHPIRLHLEKTCQTRIGLNYGIKQIKKYE